MAAPPDLPDWPLVAADRPRADRRTLPAAVVPVDLADLVAVPRVGRPTLLAVPAALVVRAVPAAAARVAPGGRQCVLRPVVGPLPAADSIRAAVPVGRVPRREAVPSSRSREPLRAVAPAAPTVAPAARVAADPAAVVPVVAAARVVPADADARA